MCMVYLLLSGYSSADSPRSSDLIHLVTLSSGGMVATQSVHQTAGMVKKQYFRCHCSGAVLELLQQGWPTGGQ